MISIVDDDPFARSAIGDLIQSLGYRAVTFPSAEHFLDSGCVGEVACLITDLQMPGMTGLDLQDHLQAAGYDTPVIVISAFLEERVRTRALNAGAIAFLRKPFQDKALIGGINTALAKPRQKYAPCVNAGATVPTLKGAAEEPREQSRPEEMH